jgi:signal transduction histidine kinase
LGKFLSDRVAVLRDGLFFHAQFAMLGGILVGALVSTGPDGAGDLAEILILGLATLTASAVAILLPWHRLKPQWLIVVPLVDVVIVVLLRVELFAVQPELTILVLIPTLWLAYSFELVGLITAIFSDYWVALFPYVLSGVWPRTPGAWGGAMLIPAIVSGVGLAVYLAARLLLRQRRQLRLAGDDLTASLASTLDSESTALAVIDNVDAGITFYDPFGRILLINDAARRLVTLAGRESADDVSSSPLVFGEDRVTPIPPIEQIVARAGRGELERGRTIWVGTGSEQRALLATSQHVRRDSGELIGTLVVLHDVTPLTQAMDARDAFLRNVSHELRTPLTSMIGYLEVISDSLGTNGADIAEPLAIAQRNSRRLLSLINSLITEAEGRTAPTRRPENVAELARVALDAVRPVATIAGITINEPQLDPVTAEVDAGDLSEVFDELLTNAIKFTTRGGSVALSVTRRNDDVVIRVTDTGIGISPHEQPHIFERFFRGSGAEIAVIAGTGLGLSRVKTIIDAHQGEISATRVQPYGTAVEIRLPMAIPHAPKDGTLVAARG